MPKKGAVITWSICSLEILAAFGWYIFQSLLSETAFSCKGVGSSCEAG
jgi:hypothetical protein